MRSLVRRTLVLLVAVTVGLAGAAEPAAADTGADEMTFVGKLNALRAAHGLRPLAIRGELFDLAREWSRRMDAAGGISHNPGLAAQVPLPWTRIGENVGVGGDVQTIHDAFVASPTHFRNMVDPAYDAVGVGVVRSAAGLTFVTVNFMTSAAPVAAGAAAPKAGRSCRTTKRGRKVCSTRRAARRTARR